MGHRRNYSPDRAGRTAMRYNEAYIHGNTVRKAYAEPRRHEPEEVLEQPKKKEVSAQVRKNRKQALHMNTAYTVFLAVATIATLAVCVWYLQLRFEGTSHVANISAMEQKLADLKEENTTRENSILDSVNLEVVRERALGLGMVHVDSDQIVTYQNPAGDYVKQYEEIPKSGVLE
ncbi:MAG: hypothetical protein PUG71_03700 [bacterium]|nr:hypothetical protein [bacterium]